MAKVVVIGAGVGGATAAALLARAGHDVTVLEAHIYPGGCAGTFYYQKYRFDAGATLAGGFHPGGPHDVVGKLLGIEWKVRPVNPAWQVLLPDRSVTQFGDRERWHAEVARAFADRPQRDRIARFFRAAEKISDAVWDFASRKPAWPPSNIGDLLRTARALRPQTLITLPHLFETMGAWARRSGLTDRAALTFLDAQLLISAQTTSDHASALFGAAASDLPRKGVTHPEGGIGGISEQLVEAIRRFGGQVLFRQEVTRLEVRDGRVVAAHTNKGARFECDVCIANLTPWDLARLLGEAAPPALQREIRTRAEPWGAFTLYLGIEDDSGSDERGSLSQFSIFNSQFTDHYQVIGSYDRPLGEGNSIFMSFSERGDLRRAPAGHRALTISTHTRVAEWWRLRETPGAKAAYDDRVAEYTERMLDLAERAVPGLRRRIRLQLPGTPVTFKFYTRRHRGGVGGFPFTSLFAARGPWTGLRNAWLVGDSIFPGQSTAGVTMGAMRVADEVLRAYPLVTSRAYSVAAK
ncbi:MAG: NAD(P)/FAD-dependent oxidoreductase [Anaerolineae bacterium]|nr:NAD(P)/FAD-dependent oxidoreductase [Candidatus Roseilinea sp.]MDW8450095.1 NAD(P)/FAD-dependent oxidoreductase [Anaerolineae bacterium]